MPASTNWNAHSKTRYAKDGLHDAQCGSAVAKWRKIWRLECSRQLIEIRAAVDGLCTCTAHKMLSDAEQYLCSGIDDPHVGHHKEGKVI